jgi:hypothetical protein
VEVIVFANPEEKTKMSYEKYMPPIDTWTDWPLQQNALLQLLRRKRKHKTLIQPAFDANRCIFVHVPKAAGTSVKKTLFPDAQGITHYRAIDYFLDSPLKFKRYFVFAFSRNPYDRLVSAYNYLLEGGKNEADLRFRDKFLTAYKSFGDFVKNGLPRKEIKNKYHFMPQYLFVVNFRGRIMVDFLGRVETIEEDFEVISKRIGVDAHLPHKNKSSRGPYEDLYTEELRIITYMNYKKDFELLGYSPDIPHC